MDRNEVYRLIDGERAYQQAQNLSDELSPTQWIDTIQYYVDKSWENTFPDAIMPNIRRIAALAIAALEQHGCPPREGYEPKEPTDES